MISYLRASDADITYADWVFVSQAKVREVINKECHGFGMNDWLYNETGFICKDIDKKRSTYIVQPFQDMNWINKYKIVNVIMYEFLPQVLIGGAAGPLGGEIARRFGLRTCLTIGCVLYTWVQLSPLT